MGGNQNFVFGLMNLFIGAVLLGAPTAIAYVLGAGESMEYMLESGEVADIFGVAISVAFQSGLVALFVGAVMTICLYGRLGGPHLHPLDAGLVLASCWCIAMSVVGLPAGVAYGIMLGRWWEVPPTIDDLAAIAVITLYFVAVMGTVYGIWRMRFYYPDRRPYRNINTTPKP
jgi:hypothetical protein